MRNKCIVFQALLLIVALGIPLVLAGCGGGSEAPLSKKEEVSIIVLLRDSQSGTHYQMEISEEEVTREEKDILLELQEKMLRINVQIEAAPNAMTAAQRRSLISDIIVAYEAMCKNSSANENDQTDDNTSDDNSSDDNTSDDNTSDDNTSDDNTSDDNTSNDNTSDDNAPDNQMKEPITLLLMDQTSQMTYAFTFDAIDLSGEEKLLVLNQANEGTLLMDVSKDPSGMTESEKQLLLQEVLALLSYVPPVLPGPNQPIATVYVDAGHGFTNSVGVPDKGTGEGSPYYAITGKYESDLNLMIALKLKEKLIANGFAVIMSRECEMNEYLSVNDRVVRINEADADIFISIHGNAASAAASGARVYWNSANGSASISEKYAQTVADAINSIGGITNKQAYAAQGNYAVVRDVHIPAVLVETCFLTNTADAQMASTPEWIDGMAEALCLGILNQYDLIS